MQNPKRVPLLPIRIFYWSNWIDKARAVAKTVINYSADSLNDAVNSFACNVPTVAVVPLDKWNGKNVLY